MRRGTGRFRDKLAEVILFFAVEWVASPEWRANYHGEDERIRYPTTVEYPTTIEEYQRHLIDWHDFDPGDPGLLPWCAVCEDAVEEPGQDCDVGDGPCVPDVADLDACHSDAHDEEEGYSSHRHA